VVVSVAMLGSGSDPAGYYLSRQANCPADYYLGAEPTGRWLGSGAAAAGLSGWVDSAGAKSLRDLLAGQPPGAEGMPAPTMVRVDPRGRLPAEPLVGAIRDRGAAQAVPVEDLFPDPVERAIFTGLQARVDKPRRGRPPTVSPARANQLATAAGIDVRGVYRGEDGFDRYATALRFADRRVDVRRPGIDVTISAPKSVSVLFALGDADVARAVRDAHQAAVGQALAYLESAAGHGLRGHQGDGQRADRIKTDGWIVAAFEHHTSRAGDPQLHTHLVVPNLLHGADGKWSAVDSKAVYRHALTTSYLYHAVFRGELTDRLGVAWTPTEKGLAELAGVPDDLISTFSTRRKQILKALRAAGRTGPQAAQAACLDTRPDKPSAETEPTLRERWAATARALGYNPRRVIDAVLGRGRAPAPPPLERLIEHLLGPAGLTAQATGFDRRDLLQAICQALPPGLRVDRAAVERVPDRVLQSRDAVRLATRSEDGPRWSTTELLGVEQAALRVADELRGAPRRRVPEDVSGTSLSGRQLSDEQLAMVRALAEASGLAVVVGPAGAGKTAALAAAVRAWEAQGRPVLGGAGRGGHGAPARARDRRHLVVAGPTARPDPSEG
jgi:conjugative relaxase-like TrwC/TraI family protein